jgi:hypothetical protein
MRAGLMISNKAASGFHEDQRLQMHSGQRRVDSIQSIKSKVASNRDLQNNSYST